MLGEKNLWQSESLRQLSLNIKVSSPHFPIVFFIGSSLSYEQAGPEIDPPPKHHRLLTWPPVDQVTEPKDTSLY